MNRRNWKEDMWRESRKKQRRRKRKLALQLFSVGMLMFFAGLYVGTVYAHTTGEQGLLAAEAQGNTPQAAESQKLQVGSAGLSGNPVDLKEYSVIPEDENTKEEERQEKEQEENLPDDWNLLLVNADHVLPEDFAVELGSIGSGHQLDIRAVEDFKEMIRAAKKERVTIYVTSSYRSMEKQLELYQDKIQEYVMKGCSYEEAQKKAATMVAVPRTSEHQLGLAVDLVSSEYRNLDEKQEKTKGFRWLKEHCSEYGFILRYPNGRSDSTGVIYEPWHFRYVGKEAAREITEQGLTLEEYLGAKPVRSEEAGGEDTEEQEQPERMAIEETDREASEEKKTAGKDGRRENT